MKRLLASPRFPWMAAALAVLLFLPALNVGFMMDDYVQRVTNERGIQIVPRPSWDLFRFVGPDRAEFALSRDRGEVPWWAPPTYKLAFFRPLSGLWAWVDYRCFPDDARLMHAENILLFAAMALLAGLLYRRLLPETWVAGLAALLFAWDDAHSFVVVWISNRNAILAGVFGLLTLWLHDRAHRDGARVAAIFAPFALALGLLAGEAAVATLGYLAAYALFLDDRAPRERLRSMAPFAFVTLAWAVIYKVRGYGTSGSGFYVDPGGEPGTFVFAVVKRLPILLLGQFGLPPADLWPQTVEPRVLPLVVVTALLAGLALIFARVIRKDRTCQFFATGMLLSLVPVCATWPNDRLLLFSGFGAFGLIATFLSRAYAVEKPGPRFSARTVAGVMILVHVVLAPLLLPLRVWAVGTMLHEYVVAGERTLPIVVGATLVVVNAPDPLVPGMAGAKRYYEEINGKPLTLRLRQLTVVATGDEIVERIDDHTLSLSASEGIFHDPFSQVFRSPSMLFHKGDIASVAGMRAEIMDAGEDGIPRRIQFHFDAPLDDPTTVWVTWVHQGFVPFKLPAPGEKVTVPGANFLEALTGQKP